MDRRPIAMTTPVARAGPKRRRSHILEALPFLLPYGIFWMLFLVWPVLYGFYISLHRWDPLRGSQFQGWGSYVRLWNDPRFWNAFWNTLELALLTVPMILGFALAFALLTHRPPTRFVQGVRAAVFFPYLLTVSIVSLVWKMLFDPDFGLIEYALAGIGVTAPTFLNDAFWVIPAISFMTAWWLSGYRVVVFLAALEDVPEELYEAARIDGASPMQQLWHITLPLLRPAILFGTVLSTISAFRTFGQVMIMTDGGPGRHSEVLSLYMYRAGFQFLDMGYAAAIGFVLFVLILAVTLINFKLLGFGSDL